MNREKVSTSIEQNKKIPEKQNHEQNTVKELKTIPSKKFAFVHFFENDQNIQLMTDRTDVFRRNKDKVEKVDNGSLRNFYKTKFQLKTSVK